MFFGDGAVQAGYFHQSVNLAALWELPVILVCENNGFAEFTPRSAHTPIERVSEVVAPYGFARETVDGGDPGAVWEAFGELCWPAPALTACFRVVGPGPTSGGARPRAGVAGPWVDCGHGFWAASGRYLFFDPLVGGLQGASRRYNTDY